MIDNYNKTKITFEELDFLIKENRLSYIMSDVYLTEEMMEKYQDKLDFNVLSMHQKMSEKFIKKYLYKLNIFRICKYQILSEKFLRNHINDVHCHAISMYQKLSKRFIKKYIDYLPKTLIFEYQVVDEIILDKYFDHNIYTIIKHQKLSENFIKEHLDIIKSFNLIGVLFKYQLMTKEFMDKILKPNMDIDVYKFNIQKYCKCFWDKRTKEEKLREMREYADKWNLEFNEDEGYLIAYREHMNYRGMFNSTIIYDKPGYYKDWRCDLNPLNENSFGLGIWPKGNVKVRVDVDDWGTTVVYDKKGKIRVFGFTLLKIN